MSSLGDLRRQLGDPNEEQRHLAVLGLAGHGAEALADLGTALGDRSWRVRKAALEAFVAIPGDEKMGILLQGIRDEQSAGRRNTSMEALIRLGEESVPYLPSLLRDRDPDVRKFGVDILGNIEGLKVLDPLVEALDDGEDNVAAAAAEYLGRRRHRPAVSALVSRARRGGFWVKYGCLKALGEIGDPAAGPAVLEAAEERGLRKVAVEALGRMGVPEAAPLVIEGLFSEDRGLRRIAVLAAARLLKKEKQEGPGVPPVAGAIRKNAGAGLIGYLTDLLRQEDPELRAAAMVVLGVAAGGDAAEPLLGVLADAPEEEQSLIGDILGELPEEDLPSLFPRLRDPQPAVRRWVARILGLRRCLSSVPELVGLLEDENGHVRGDAARALGRIGDRHALASLVSLLGDPYPDVRQAGVDALSALGEESEQMRRLVVDALGPRLDSEDQDLVANTLRVFARLGSREVLERLRFSLKDERSQIRRAAVEALGAIEGAEAGEVLRLALTDEDASVRREAVQRLGGRKTAGAVDILLPMLQDEDLWVRVRAVQAMAADGGSEARKAILDTARREAPGPVRLAAIRALGQTGAGLPLLLELSSSGDREGRMAAIEALGHLADAAAVESLLASLRDGDWGVRSAAVRALARLGGEERVREALQRAAREDADQMVRKAAEDALSKDPP